MSPMLNNTIAIKPHMMAIQYFRYIYQMYYILSIEHIVSHCCTGSFYFLKYFLKDILILNRTC